MTAYGRAELKHGENLYVAEIKGVNNRYCDVVLRIPRKFQQLEKDLKGLISSRIRRGRIETTIQTTNGSGEAPYSLELNLPLADAYLKIYRQLADHFGIDEKINVDTLLQLKDLLLFKPEEVDLEEERPCLMEVLDKALDSFEEMRAMEGAEIEKDFIRRLGLVEQYLGEIHKRAPQVVEEYSIRLKENINKITQDIEINEEKVYQEVAFFAERSDITEEIVRIKSHLKQFGSFLQIDDAMGRRLDFLLQEFNREVNTIGSKGSDALISKYVVEMKAELEKIREQVQNVE